MTSFLEEARAQTTRLRRAIHDLPFNRELAQGVLRRDRFQHYLVQDSLYLTAYARALSMLAVKAPTAQIMVQFNQAAAGAVLFEQAMQRDYLDGFGVVMTGTEPSPTCLAYTSFMLTEAQTGSYETLLASVLPCFSIYAEVGTAIAAQAVKDNPFQLWIDTYASPEFQVSVMAAEAAAEGAAAEASPSLRRRMLALFQRSVEFEWMFWDAAYRLEAWPTRSFR
nr:TenA family protein [uncultured Dongia sp.]